MKIYRSIIFVFLLAWAALPVLGQSVSIDGPDRTGLVEGESYTFTWSAEGVESISLAAHGIRTPLGKYERGTFNIVIAAGVPAEQDGFEWTLPWIDATTFFIKVKGYDSSGNVVAVSDRGYSFRPEAMKKKLANGIYLDLSKRDNQRLYVQMNGKITRTYYTSSSENYLWKPRAIHLKIPHDHAGVFRVLSKEPDHYSRLFEVHMRWAMRYLGGHYIHATSSNLYSLLGRPASHGCNRMTYYDAKELYEMTPKGTRVEVIGPKL